MALINSLNLPLGISTPEFVLPTPDGQVYDSKSLIGEKGLLIAFTCNHCPYAIAIWPRLIELAKFILPNGINTIAINPNIHPNYPDDAPEKMQLKIKEWGISFPYLVDATQEVAKKFQAQCTPDLYLIDHTAKLVYHGQLDDNWKHPDQVTKQELLIACENLARGLEIPRDQKPSMGCSIKWL